MNSFDLLKDSFESRKWIANNIPENTELISICSAYLKEDALNFLLKIFSDCSYRGSIRILARWKPHDLLAGSSDLTAYDLALKNNIPFFIKQDFHGKVYEIKPVGLLVGSANLTNSGFQFDGSGNSEVCVALEHSIQNSLFVQNLFDSSLLVNESIFSSIKNELGSMKLIEFPDYQWSSLLSQDIKYYSKSDKFLTDEMFYSNVNDFFKNINHGDFAITHDLSLLGCTSKSCRNEYEIAFLNSISYKWLISTLKKHYGIMSYGTLTSNLHSSLLDEPSPYRRDVKCLLSNLLSWCGEYSLKQIEISRPRHSPIIKLIND